MRTEMSTSPSFNGKGIIRTYTKRGKLAQTLRFETSKAQDALVKTVSDTVAENGLFNTKIAKENGEKMKALFDGIIGKKIRRTNQETVMTNGKNIYVEFGDENPKAGGAFVHLDYNL